MPRVDLVLRAVEGERDGLIRGFAGEVIDETNFDFLRHIQSFTRPYDHPQ